MQKLIIYQKSKELLKEIYKLIFSTKIKNDYGLSDQLKRAALSVVLNIAEGYGRGPKHFRNYLLISNGSVNETIACLEVIEDIYSIPTKTYITKYEYLGRQISVFSSKLKSQYSKIK